MKNPTKRSHELLIIAAAVEYATRYAWILTPGAFATDEAKAVVRAVNSARAAGALPRRGR